MRGSPAEGRNGRGGLLNRPQKLRSSRNAKMLKSAHYEFPESKSSRPSVLNV